MAVDNLGAIDSPNSRMRLHELPSPRKMDGWATPYYADSNIELMEQNALQIALKHLAIYLICIVHVFRFPYLWNLILIINI